MDSKPKTVCIIAGIAHNYLATVQSQLLVMSCSHCGHTFSQLINNQNQGNNQNE